MMFRQSVALSVAMICCVGLTRPVSGEAAKAVASPTNPVVVRAPPVSVAVSVTRREFSELLHQKFGLRSPAAPVSFPDVSRNDQNYAAIEAAAPYMNEQILCPGCYLHPNFFPDQPVSQSLAAVAIVRILVAQNRMHLPSLAEAEGTLAGVPGGRNVPRDAKPYIAAATRHGLVVTEATSGLQLKALLSRTDLDVILDKAVKVQLPAPPPIK